MLMPKRIFVDIKTKEVNRELIDRLIICLL